MAGGGGGELNIEFTPTWVVALVCTVIVSISLSVERFLHFLGKYLKKKKQQPLFEALLKVKEELMLLGFISLVLVAFQGLLQRICIAPGVMEHMTPCKKERRIVATGLSGLDNCSSHGKVPLLSLDAIHQLHIFIFVLALTHVIFTLITMVLGSFRIQEWKSWEDKIQREGFETDPHRVISINQHEFIKSNFKGHGLIFAIQDWLHAFVKQFYGSVTKTDYTTMRLGFIMTHCQSNPKFNFHKYMVRALEADFKKVVGISWYLWIFVVIFLLLNISGWNTYFWISFLPLILLVAVGTKLVHVIMQLAHDIADKHTAVEGDLVVTLSDDHFWFHEPRIVLYLFHFILFQIAFEFAFFFWILIIIGSHSCMIGKASYIIIKLIIGAVVQLVCSYSTFPLYAIVTQMGSSFKKVIFEENVQRGIDRWAMNARNAKGRKPNTANLSESLAGQSEIHTEETVRHETAVNPSETVAGQSEIHAEETVSHVNDH